jgi:hypothetical protein
LNTHPPKSAVLLDKGRASQLPISTTLNVLLPTIGSAGDVHPVIGLALALRARGHRATILTNPFFQDLIEKTGLGFLPVGTMEEARATIADPDLWHPRKGFGVVARNAILPAIPRVFKLIEKHSDSNTVVAASGISFGARVAQEKLGVPTATVHLQPSIIRSLVDQGMAGNILCSYITAASGPWPRPSRPASLTWSCPTVTISSITGGGSSSWASDAEYRRHGIAHGEYRQRFVISWPIQRSVHGAETTPHEWIPPAPSPRRVS